jgi:hypothetical protein
MKSFFLLCQHGEDFAVTVLIEKLLFTVFVASARNRKANEMKSISLNPESHFIQRNSFSLHSAVQFFFDVPLETDKSYKGAKGF